MSHRIHRIHTHIGFAAPHWLRHLRFSRFYHVDWFWVPPKTSVGAEFCNLYALSVVIEGYAPRNDLLRYHRILHRKVLCCVAHEPRQYGLSHQSVCRAISQNCAKWCAVKPVQSTHQSVWRQRKTYCTR
jgi:hypothetical protein